MRPQVLAGYCGLAVALAIGIGLIHGPAVAQSSSPIRTAFVIVFENHDWSEIAGSPAAPYINKLLSRASYARNYSTPPGVHPSTPDYLWMEAGQDFGLSGLSNYTPAQYHQSTTNHLVTQLNAAGISWKTYHEDIDGLACPLTDVNRYTVHHNPFVFFDDVTNSLDPNSAYCISHVRPFTELATDLAQNSVARYNFIVPNLCNDMHDCSITSGDTWLSNNLPAILNSQAYLDGGAVFITWDEGASATSDGPIGMIVMSPSARANGYSNSISYTHSSLLLTLQELFGVRPLLGDAANATDLSDLFASFPAVVPSSPTPADTFTGANTTLTLKWSSSGGNDEVRFGTTNPPPSVAVGVSTRSYSPASLLPNTVYHWQVVSTTASGTTAGPVWSFTTGSGTSAWTNADIGAVGLAGSVLYSGSSITVQGAGADIWGTADALQFVYQSLPADGQILARVTSLKNTSSYAKAGVMIRSTLAAGSDHVILDTKPDGEVEFMQRATAGGSTTYIGGTTLSFPEWLRLTRSGTSITSAVSSDGVTWRTIGTVTTSMNGAVLVGLPVCSHTTSALTTAVFDNVAVSSADTAAPTPPSSPTTPNPADAATAIATTPTLTWTASGATSYDVNFGTGTPPPAVATGLASASYSPGVLASGTTYHWQVVARNAAGSTAGPVWSFTTATTSPAPPPASGAANVWVTTADGTSRLTPQASVAFAADSGTNPLTVDVDSSTTYQQMDGFGASFTDSSAWLVYNKLSASARSQLMTQLFDRTNGIGLSYLRQPMGASDFALSAYTYDDVAAGQVDPNLASFSIGHDQAYILPVLQQALQVNPQLRIMATPWSAPAWMKSSQSLLGGSLNASAMSAYANYFVKFIQAYQAAGVSVDRITPQNEPHYTPPDYPGMFMEYTDEATFVKNYLGPALSSAGLKTGIAVWDHNWDDTGYAANILSDSAAYPYVAGSAWHCYAGAPGAMSTVHDAYPAKGIYLTECSAPASTGTFGQQLASDMENLVIGGPRNWARTVIKWNIALDTNHGPHTGGCTNCTGLVTIDQSTGAVSFNYDYYSIGHISKFVTPGAYRVGSNTFGSGSIEDVAFVNPDGTRAVVVLNSAASAQTFKLRESGRSFVYTLPAGAVATFTWAGSPVTGGSGGGTGSTALPSPWTDLDIGSVGLAGSASYSNGTFTVKGAGADIWGTADAFNYVYQPLAGDGQIVARVGSLQNTDTFAKAGVMIRTSLSAGSDHVILDVRPGGGVEFMQRATSGGTTTYIAGTTATFPTWLRLTRSGATVTGAVSPDGKTWSTVGTATMGTTGSVFAGLPVTSHTTTSLTTATFDNVALTATAGQPPSAPASPSPADGATGVATNATLTWSAAGATSYDVAFGTTNPPPMAATGLASASYAPTGLAAGTKYYWQVVAHNAAGATTGVVWSFTTAVAATAPPGTPASPTPANGATGVATSASLTWSATGATSYDVAFGTANPPPLAATGLATASYSPAGMTTGTTYYWQVVARNTGGTTTGPVWSFATAAATPPPTTGTLPSPWVNQDIGVVGLAGSASYASGVFTVKGAGSDIWGSTDAFQYVYHPLDGNGQITARVTGEQNTNAHAKAGVMMRQSLAANSAEVILDVKPGGGIEFLVRATTGGATKAVASSTAAFPVWLRLVRSSNTFTAYASADGATWTKIGTTTASMSSSVNVGLAVCSHATGALNTATFDNVQ